MNLNRTTLSTLGMAGQTADLRGALRGLGEEMSQLDSIVSLSNDRHQQDILSI
jgi:hypothetical protein